MLKIVDITLFDIPAFILKRKIPKEVLVDLAGVLRICSLMYVCSSSKFSLLIPVRLTYSDDDKAVSESKLIFLFSRFIEKGLRNCRLCTRNPLLRGHAIYTIYSYIFFSLQYIPSCR